MSTDGIVLAVCRIRGRAKDGTSCQATGFLYRKNQSQFLISNRHVVVDEEQNFQLERLSIRLHTDQNSLKQNEEVSIPLLDVEGNPLWHEHPEWGSRIDVIAIPIPSSVLHACHVVRWLGSELHVPQDIAIPLGQELMVVGYPLAFCDETHNLPIARSAMVSSLYPVPFEGEPYFLVDARLHRGASGSPVFTKPASVFARQNGNTWIPGGTRAFLVGVFSATLDIPSRDREIDEPLGLGCVWFAPLISDILKDLE